MDKIFDPRFFFAKQPREHHISAGSQEHQYSIWLAGAQDRQLWYNHYMRYDYDTPVARDYEGVRLTADQIYQINMYLDRAASGAYSRQFFQDLYDLGNTKFQKAIRMKDSETSKRLGPELQVINHVLKVAFRGTQPTKVGPDPNHMKFVAYEEAQARAALPVKDYSHPNRWVVPYWGDDYGDPMPMFEMLRILARAVQEQFGYLYDIAFNPYEVGQMETIYEIDGKPYATASVIEGDDNLIYSIFYEGERHQFESIDDALTIFTPNEQQTEEVEEEEDPADLAWLAPELRADVVPLSDDPNIASLQERLRSIIIEMREAEEDQEPPFIVKGIQRRLAAAHEALIEARNRRYY